MRPAAQRFWLAKDRGFCRDRDAVRLATRSVGDAFTTLLLISP